MKRIRSEQEAWLTCVKLAAVLTKEERDQTTIQRICTKTFDLTQIEKLRIGDLLSWSEAIDKERENPGEQYDQK